MLRRGAARVALLIAFAACSGGSGFPDAGVDTPPATGRFSVDWTLADGDRALTCSEVGAIIMSVTATSPDQGGGFVEAFSCDAGTGISRALPVGRYDLLFEMKGSSGSLGTLPFQQVGITTDSVTPAPAQRFSIKAEGKVDARLLAGDTANCAPTGKITAMSLVLERQNGPCVPATFAIAAGATAPATTYTSTCPPDAPAQGPCIERDQAITTTVGSGGYVLRVRGNEAAAQCWSADQLEDIPPLERVLRVDVALTYLKGPSCP